MYIFNLIHIIPQGRTLSYSPPSFRPRIQDSTWSIVEGDRSSNFPGIKKIRPSLIRDYRWPKCVLAAGLDRESVVPDGSMRRDLSSAPKSTGKSSNSYTFFFFFFYEPEFVSICALLKVAQTVQIVFMPKGNPFFFPARQSN